MHAPRLIPQLNEIVQLGISTASFVADRLRALADELLNWSIWASCLAGLGRRASQLVHLGQLPCGPWPVRFSTGPFGPVALRALAGALLNWSIWASCLAGLGRCASQLVHLGQLPCGPWPVRFSTGPFGPVALRALAGALLNWSIWASCLAGLGRRASQLVHLGQLPCGPWPVRFSTGPFGPVALRALAGALLNWSIWASCLAGLGRCASQLVHLGQLPCGPWPVRFSTGE